MGNPYPIEFVQVADNIEIREEEFDVVRTIYMQGKGTSFSVPNNVKYSHLGYSVGYWDDENSLVVATNKINWPYFNRVGIRQSDVTETLEHFTVNEDQGHLNYYLKVIDPTTLTEPYEFESRWQWIPGEEVGKYDCAVD